MAFAKTNENMGEWKMEIQVIRDHLDIVKLQEKMNSIVFDYLDTSNNYTKAMDLNAFIYTGYYVYKEYL
ncbi:putative protein OS=Lysinibacillus sphaericus OX=1421 GN=LYSIN_00363 PE=4 SV=1 [Lysinibacillus sphaericus]